MLPEEAEAKEEEEEEEVVQVEEEGALGNNVSQDYYFKVICELGHFCIGFVCLCQFLININVGKIEKKRCSMSLAIREVQIKATMIFYYVSAKLTKIKNIDNTKYWRGFTHCWWECKTVQPLKNSVAIC